MGVNKLLLFAVLSGWMGVQAAPGDLLMQSRFLRDTAGWFVTFEGKAPEEGIQIEHDRSAQRVKAGDRGDISWYFQAPDMFLGNQQSLYHSILYFSLGHYIYDVSGGNPSDKVADVVLESKKKRLKLGVKHLFEVGSSGKEYAVSFSAEPFSKQCNTGSSSEACSGHGDACVDDDDCCSKQCVGTKARWYNLKTGRAARNSEILDALSDVSSFKIRGGYFPGGIERTWLKNPKILEGGLVNRTDAGPDQKSTNVGRSQMCQPQKSTSMRLRPADQSQLFNTRLIRPWTHYYTFPNFPEVCSDATLTVEATGDLIGEHKYVGILGESGEHLGKLFVTAGDFSETAQACPAGEQNCKPNDDGASTGNASNFMAADAINTHVVTDGIVLTRAQMAAYSANREFKIGLFVEQDNLATEVEIFAITIQFGIGGCYTRRPIKFPGLDEKPARYSGYYTSLSLPNAPLPDDSGAIMLNVTGAFDQAESFVTVVFSDVTDPGPYGPGFAPVPTDGSQSEIAPTGNIWDFPLATKLFTVSIGSVPGGTVRNRREAGAVGRGPLQTAAQQKLEAGQPLKLAVLVHATPEVAAHPNNVQIHEATVIYPPKACTVVTLLEGQAIPGLLGHPINREIQYCKETWECDTVGVFNRKQFDSEEACVEGCRASASRDSAPGRCYQPFVPDGQCATAAQACMCTQLGVAECVSGSTKIIADGTCRCVESAKCTRTPINASLPFQFESSTLPVGDMTLSVEASLPWPHVNDYWLRIRLGERDRRVLGYVFGTPDCSSDCNIGYPDNDPTIPLIDSIRISNELALEAMSDGKLDILVEIDEPRQELSCALHPEHERCFASLAAQGKTSDRFSQYPGIAQLTAPISSEDATFNITSVAAIGLVASELDCSDGDCRRMFILIGGEELMEVTAMDGNTLTVIRGSGSSTKRAHSLGTCNCGLATNFSSSCEQTGNQTLCVNQGGTWDATFVQRIDAALLPALQNLGEFTLRSLTLSFATSS